uniref:NADH-ubiquinone oxidoreductase chain 2 n=1 Tax=Crompus oculatus TaxID=2813432 RepID=A0A8T9ZXX9_9HEMI|nr:NADH dehydrogenase subunit 2 [Crompus oculatus]
MNFSKMMFLIIMIFSSLFTISSSNWIGMWMGLEINLMAFIPVMASMKNKKSSQALIIYFFTQSIGSIMMLFSILMYSMINISPLMLMDYMKLFMTTGLIIKLGMAPFHNWLPEAMSNLNWEKNLLLMTWQKLAPMYMLSNMYMDKLFMIIIISSAIVGAIGGLNYSSLRKIMAYSSINHMSWMSMMMISQTQWIKYFIIYSIILIMLCSILKYYNILFINQINYKMKSNLEKITFSILMMSMGGLPPFLGFLPKWMVIQSMLINNMFLPMMIMIMMTLLTLFYYLRMISAQLMMYSNSLMWNKKMKMKIMYMYLMINLMLPMFSIMSFF